MFRVQTAVAVILAIGGTVAPAHGREQSRSSPAPAAVVAATSPGNLIVNPGAEAGPGSADGQTGGTPIPGWVATEGSPIANKYAIGRPFISAADPGPTARGLNYFAGGDNTQFSQIAQTIALKSQITAIDLGRAGFTLSGWLGGVGAEDDSAYVSAYFKDGLGTLVGEAHIGPVSAKERGNATALLYRELVGTVPTQTRSVDVYVQFNRQTPTYSDGVADNLALSIYDARPDLSSLPPELVRRALRHLESLKGSGMAPGWGPSARLVGYAVPLFRPDLGDVAAYYDFPIVSYAPPPTLTVNVAAQGPLASAPPLYPAGFIVLSTGDHDFPVSHWSDAGDSPTSALTKLSISGDHGLPAKFLRLDALNYVAQDAAGRKVAELGTPVNRIIGQSAYPTTTTPLTTKAWSPIGNGADISTLNAPQDISHTLTVTGPLTGTFVLTGWQSLDETKDGYVTSYGTMIESLRAQASGDWEAEQSAATYGEVLRKGDVFTIPVPLAASEVTFTGPGLADIQTDALTDTFGLRSARITVLKDESGKEVPFTATVSLSNEVIKFTIIPPVFRVMMPVLLDSNLTVSSRSATALGETARALPQQVEAPEDWGPWNYFWAGNTNDQRQYGQIPANTGPNTNGCPSGCGGTAWAMLFGWADHQAALGNSYWAPRRGIYRENGGYGFDADAPQLRDSGVTNMTWEIHNRIGTWCTFGSAPTVPWDMDNAQGYLTNRSYAHVSTHYNVLGIHEDRLRDYARDSIVYRHTPAIIGTGWLTHYPLAYGYAWTSRSVRHCFIVCWNTTDYARSFYVNEGWPGAGNNFGWINAGTWFAGELYP